MGRIVVSIMMMKVDTIPPKAYVTMINALVIIPFYVREEVEEGEDE